MSAVTEKSLPHSSDTERILERAGYVIRGKRATCPHCKGNRRQTVAIHGDLFYCHRCARGGNVRTLARGQGIKLPPPCLRLADRPKQEFRTWIGMKMAELANLERKFYQRAEWAKAALAYYPDMQCAWDALADWCHARHTFITFWQSASDKVGRYWLYRTWRKQHRAY